MILKYLHKVRTFSNVQLHAENKYLIASNKQKFNMEQFPTESNKENFGVMKREEDPNNSTTRKNSFSLNTSANTKPLLRPKRLSELPFLNSDSEEDDSMKDDDDLNRAILNESFMQIQTPCKYDGPNNNESYLPNEKPDELSLLDGFNRLNVKSCIKDNGRNFPDFPDNVIDSNKNMKVQENETPLKPLKPLNTNKVMPTIDKTKKVPDDEKYITPQIRALSVKNPSKNLLSTQMPKPNRSCALNEFRSQKVLFQTPMSLARPPLSCLPNDSISLILCDTIPEDNSSISSDYNISASRSTDKETPVTSNKSLDVKDMNGNIEALQAHINKSKQGTTTIEIKNIMYSISQKLGCGGSSIVYAAKRLHNDQECAIKIVDLQGEPAIVEGYLNEIKLLAKLQGNVSVVSLYDFQLFPKESKLIIVMERGDSDLSKILQNYSTDLPLYVLTNFLYQMLQAVDYIHQNGVIHSDLKPANFLMINGRLKLIDFGIASNIAVDATSIIKCSQAGTFNYISPEALIDISTGNSPSRSKAPKIKISTKSDVWSLGCILYLFLYKKTPFSHIKNIYAKMTAISNPKHTIEYNPLPVYYPIMLNQMVKNCLQHNPKERPSCAELLQYPFHMIIPIQNLTVPQK